MNATPQHTIALFPWGDVWEDFFHTIDISLDSFANEFTGGWQFGMIEALKLYGVQTVIFYPSTLVSKPQRFVHQPTQTPVWLLPVPWIYRLVRRFMVHPYPSLAYWGTVEDLFGKARRPARSIYAVLRHIAPYLSTPLSLIARNMRKERCSIVLCQEYEYFRFDLCILLGKIMKVPVFATFQGGTYDCNSIGRYLHRFTIKRCDGLLIGPQAEIERVKSQYHLQASQLARIFNPIDVSMWTGADRENSRGMFNLPEQAEVILWHGRVDVHNKGLDLLLAAWMQVAEKYSHKDIRLFLLGSAEDAEQLRQALTCIPSHKLVWIDQYVKDRKRMRDFLAAGDIYVFPSRWEGFPVAPLEAMACGLPVIAAEAAGVRDIFEYGEASGGIVVPREDSDALAQAIGKLLEDRNLRNEMGKRARQRVVENFSYDRIGRQLFDFLTTRQNPEQHKAE